MKQKPFIVLSLINAILCGLMLCAGCTSTRQQPTEAMESELQLLNAQSAQIIAETQKHAETFDLIRFNDNITIQIWLRDQRTQLQGFPLKQTVPNSGNIFIPDMGLTQVAGRTDAELKEILTRFFEKTLNNPTIVVEHEQKLQSADAVLSERYVTIMGWVKEPGVHPFKHGMTIRDLIAAAGDIKPFSNPRKIYLVRGTVENPEVIRVNLPKIRKGKNMELNVVLRPNDAVYVPSVGMWKTYDFIRTMLLPVSAVRDAIFLAWGS